MKKALIILAVVLCLSNAVRRINYIYRHFTLRSLIAHEKGTN